jgi:superfamily II DNA/RNA helicase
VEVELPRKLRQLPDELQPVETFAELRCGRVLGRNLRWAGFEVPTPVQANAVPMAIGGLDVISIAQTGSGKTLAFMLPILRSVMDVEAGAASERRGRDDPVAIRALVLCVCTGACTGPAQHAHPVVAAAEGVVLRHACVAPVLRQGADA